MSELPLARKFDEPLLTAKDEPHAWVSRKGLETLWFNTGTLCNLTCQHCQIESSPKNDRLVYLSAAEVGEYLDEIEARNFPTSLIGFTGGEPFMNPELSTTLGDVLSRGLRALVLTNAMKPMMKCKRHVRELTHGRETNGCRRAHRRRLHPIAVRCPFRTRPYSARGQSCRPAQSPALRQILRAWWRSV